MKPLAPNTMIQNRYLVVHLIGKGGMGEVYLAVDQRLGSAIALKRTFFADNETLGNAFEREAKILARLRHPVLPKVSDHFSENGDQYLVMEHISGDDLSKRLESANKPFPVSWVMFWADQLLDALTYLHSHEPPIIHRDIKPQNLKLTDENHIILLDFGLSKDSSGQTIASKPGSSGSVVGYTPHFASMEQIRGTGTDGRSDLYSLSATLYQLMTNVVPADALSRADTMLSGKTDPIIALSDANPEISPAVSNVILKGLEVSKDKRFGTAAEMQKALRTAYSQMQNQMSAETQVFNVGDLHSTVPPAKDPSVPLAPSEMATRMATVPPAPAVVSQSADNNFDATLAMDADEAQEVVRQADVRTEVFNAGSFDQTAANDEVPPPVVSEPPPSPFDSTRPVDESVPAATVPLISIDENVISPASAEPAAPEFFTTPVAEVRKEDLPPPVVSSAVSAGTSAGAASANSQTAEKKSGSKAFLILGGLAAFFLLMIGALGGGWYYYTNYYLAGDTKPTPTPSATPVASPTTVPSPSPTASPDGNSNSNTNSDDIKTVEPTPVPTPTQTAGPRPAQTPVVVDRPVKPARTPGPKATPKPKPNNDRTVILQ
ncbi:MAG: protein kinase [Pyrinomonadaceae bacterium]|nr:protein kinase [Pyrinomonadaceae bacterium]